MIDKEKAEVYGRFVRVQAATLCYQHVHACPGMLHLLSIYFYEV